MRGAVLAILLVLVALPSLAPMSDEELLDFWNDHIEAREDDCQSLSYTATQGVGAARGARRQECVRSASSDVVDSSTGGGATTSRNDGERARD